MWRDNYICYIPSLKCLLFVLCDCISGFSLRNSLTEVVRHPHPDAFFSYLLKIHFSFHKGLHFFLWYLWRGSTSAIKTCVYISIYNFCYCSFFTSFHCSHSGCGWFPSRMMNVTVLKCKLSTLTTSFYYLISMWVTSTVYDEVI